MKHSNGREILQEFCCKTLLPNLYCTYRKKIQVPFFSVFSEKLTPKEKMILLKDNYGIEPTRELEEGVQGMCNLSDAIEEKGIEKGIEALVITCKSLHCTKEDTARRLRTLYDFDSDEAAMEKVNLYW